MKSLKYVVLILLIVHLVSCRKKEFNNPLDDWFKDPPVAPITQTIKTVIPIGYAASLVISDMKGYKASNVKSVKQKSANLLHVNTSLNYPYRFKDDVYGEMIIAYVQTGVNSALVSVFFTDMNIVSGSFKLLNVIAFPVIFDPLNNKITAIYAAIDINLGDNLFPGIDLTQEQIDASMAKLNNQRSNITEIAIAQNAWIIDIYNQGSFTNFYDDKFNIYGGQQSVSVDDYVTESSTGVLQMAMIDVDFSSDCIKNPTNGFVFMQDVEVATSGKDADIVFGHVFYEFHPSCDGEILVNIATGNFIFAIGKELDLGLN